jgi:hypothetical protein
MTDAQKQFLLDSINNLHREDVNTLVTQLDINADVAHIPSQNTTTKSKPKSKINDAELDRILAVIRKNFDATEFQNKDLSPLIDGLTARQVPSRIKKLVDAGLLTDLGGSPKKYILV